MYIIIGGSSFIGVHTAEEFLTQGCEILVTGRNNKYREYYEERGASYLNLDLSRDEDFQQLPQQGVDGVILLAGLLPANAPVNLDIDENAADYFEINTKGTIRVLEYCRKNNINRVISTSSYADVRNAWKKGVALKETEPRNFMYTGDHAVYVISKNAANDVMEYYNEQHGMQCASFRLPPVYGVGPHSEIYVNGKYYKTGIQTFIENAEAGKDIEIWGDPQISRDIIYVKDVARAFALALRSDKTYGLYNMTSGTEVTLEEQVQTVIDVFGPGKGSKIVYRPDKPNNTPSFLFDMTKAKEDFGFVPEYLSYRAIMEDYKKELESGRWDKFIASRRKES